MFSHGGWLLRRALCHHKDSRTSACVCVFQVPFLSLTHAVKKLSLLGGSLMERVWASVLAPLTRGQKEIYVSSSMTNAFREIDKWECIGGVYMWAGFKVVQSAGSALRS